MRSRWNEAEAASLSGLDLLAYASRLIGAETSLVVWGGGNTSIKLAERDHRSRAVDVPTQGNAGASFYGRDSSPGTARLVVDDDRGIAVGATFTGPEVAEFLHAATIAVVAEVPLERLFHAVPAFPTRSEVWLYLLEALGLAGPCYELTPLTAA